jgi:glycosyltransferase involved in cell wall biosynthesis
MVSKACLVGAYQKKLEAIAAHDDVELTVIVPPSWDDPAGRMTLERSYTAGYDLKVEPLRFNGQYHLHYYPTLNKRMSELKPDIVHMDEEPYNLATWLGVRAAKKQGAKSLFFSWQNLKNDYPFPFRRMEQTVLNSVDYALVGNQASENVWREKGFTGKVAVIPQFGIDPTLFSPPAKKDYGRGFVIGSAGRRIVPEKGLDVLLEAAAQLDGMWQVNIAGDGPELPALKQLAKKLGIQDRVNFDGVIPSERVPAYLQQLDVLVLPSRTLSNWKEQFGRVLIEAMACGVAVVGSDSGEIPNVIGNAGLIFAEDNVTALRIHLYNLLQHPDQRKALAEIGRAHVLAHYTQEKIAAQTVQVYREMMAI